MDNYCYSVLCMPPDFCEYVIRYFNESHVELRLDTLDLDKEELHSILSVKHTSKVIAACPYLPKYDNSIKKALDILGGNLSLSIEYGVDYIDVSEHFKGARRLALIKKAKAAGCGVILSDHRMDKEETVQDLIKRAEGYFKEGADIVKLVIKDNSSSTKQKEIYQAFNGKAGRIICFNGTSKSAKSRLLSLKLGAPFTYVALGLPILISPGELTYYDTLTSEKVKINGEMSVPFSKSMAQRAIILAALAEGKSTLLRVTLCDDVNNAIEVAKALGAKVTVDRGKYAWNPASITVEGAAIKKASDFKIPKDGFIHVGESGFLARVCVALSAVSGKEVIIMGEKTLLHRKFGKEFGALKSYGVDVKLSRGEFLPAQVCGKLDPGVINLSGTYGSQLISGLLMALPLSDSDIRLQIINVASLNYIFLTDEVMEIFGVKTKLDCDADFKRMSVNVKGKRHYKPVHIDMERDWSAASMVLAAGCLAGSATVADLPLDTNQPDCNFRTMLLDLGIDFKEHDYRGAEGLMMELTCRRSLLMPFECNVTNMPDIFPAIFLLALRCGGPSIITGISRLRNKESDRAASFCEEFSKLGVKITVDDEKMIIEGHTDLVMHGCEVSSHGDHRLAMALLAASLIADGEVKIDDLTCLDKSYPDFRTQLQNIVTDRSFTLPE